MVSVQTEDVPEQSPVGVRAGYITVLQLVNTAPLAGVAVKVTIVLAGKFAPQVPDELPFITLQLIPDGELTTVPFAPLGRRDME